MDIEEMKPQWQSAREAIRPGHEQQFDTRRRTSLLRLAHRYKVFTCLPLVLILTNANNLVMFHSAWQLAGFVLLMAACAAESYYLMRRLSAIDTARMPVKEVLRRITDCRKSHLTFVAIGMPCALLWCLSLAYSHRADTALTRGILAGILMGLLIGLRILQRYLKDYRKALEE